MRKAAEIVRNQSNVGLPAIYASAKGGWHSHPSPIAGPLEVFEVNYLHYHDTLELGLCVQGHGICRVEDTEFPFGPGDAQVIFPFQRHLSKSVGPDSSHWYWLNLDPVTLLSAWNPAAAPGIEEAYFRQMGIYGIFSPSEQPRLAEQVSRIIRVDSVAEPLPEHRSDYLCANLYVLILELYRASIALPKLNLAPESRFLTLRPALNAIENGLSGGDMPSVSRLADLCGMSEATFRRAFHTSIGQAPGDYISACRLRRAQLALVFSEQSILEIALNAGFDDPSGFYRCFRHQCGMSPSTYRKLLRREKRRM